LLVSKVVLAIEEAITRRIAIRGISEEVSPSVAELNWVTWL
jgi:hypothetical protein